MNNTITFTPETFENLRKSYQTALQNKREVFKFEGHDLLTDYAKYLIQYLTPKFQK
jgi:hypothetical protein